MFANVDFCYRFRSKADVDAYRNEHQITLVGRDIPKPIMTFEEANLPDFLMESFTKSGYKAPTPIQAQGWPMALSGRDMVGVAKTGSGKTLAVSFFNRKKLADSFKPQWPMATMIKL
jgi:ATP-dependent RNA helicase DDX5/DBP2